MWYEREADHCHISRPYQRLLMYSSTRVRDTPIGLLYIIFQYEYVYVQADRLSVVTAVVVNIRHECSQTFYAQLNGPKCSTIHFGIVLEPFHSSGVIIVWEPETRRASQVAAPLEQINSSRYTHLCRTFIYQRTQWIPYQINNIEVGRLACLYVPCRVLCGPLTGSVSVVGDTAFDMRTVVCILAFWRRTTCLYMSSHRLFGEAPSNFDKPTQLYVRWAMITSNESWSVS